MVQNAYSPELLSRAQVSLRYLLSADFAQLAMQRTGRDDPTFMDTQLSCLVVAKMVNLYHLSYPQLLGVDRGPPLVARIHTLETGW